MKIWNYGDTCILLDNIKTIKKINDYNDAGVTNYYIYFDNETKDFDNKELRDKEYTDIILYLEED